MIKNIHIQINIASYVSFLSGILLLTACGQETDIPPTEENVCEDVQLSFSACLVSEGMPSGRTTVEGDRFPANNSAYVFGTWICLHEDTPTNFISAKDGYSNLRTEMKASGEGDDYKEAWTYVFKNRPHSSLNVSRRVPIDIYVCYPQVQTTTRPDLVTFTSGQTDWMWAHTYLSGDELSGDKATVKLQFEHAMTCMEIRIKSIYAGCNLTSITLKDRKSRLYSKGNMNLAKQTLLLDNADKTDALKIVYNTELRTTGSVFHIIMPEITDYEDGDFTLSFVFNGVPAKTEFTIPAEMSNGAKVTEFARGKRYIYNLILDNHISFEPVSVDDTWVTNDYELIL